MATVLNIPIISNDSHMAKDSENNINNSHVREQIKAVNKRFNYKDIVCLPATVSDYIKNFDKLYSSASFDENKFSSFSLFNIACLDCDDISPTQSFVSNYRSQISNVTYQDTIVAIDPFIQNTENNQSLLSIMNRLTSYYNSENQFSSEERINKIANASTSYLLTLSAVVFYLMELASKTLYLNREQTPVFDINTLNSISQISKKYGFTLNFDNNILSSISYNAFTFELYNKKEANDKNYTKVENILGEKITNLYKMRCIVDHEKITYEDAMVLIPFGVYNTNARRHISKQFAAVSHHDKLPIISNKELIQLIDHTHLRNFDDTHNNLTTSLTDFENLKSYIFEIQPKDFNQPTIVQQKSY